MDVFGSGGTGKTQLAMQVSIHAVSEGDHVLFVDTTGAFRPERTLEMLRSNGMSPGLLDNIVVLRTTNVSEQMSSLSKINASEYSLVIIDNVSELFSFEYANADQFLAKNRLLLKHMKGLSTFAIENGVTVILTNAVRTADDRQVESHEKLINMFAHVKIKLEKDAGGRRRCTCSTAFDKVEFSFDILPSGLAVLP